MADKVNNQKSLLQFFKPNSSCKTTLSSTKQSKTEFASIPGFTLITNFITEAEETYLWQAIYKQPWNTQFKRRIQYYGFKHADDERERLICLGELPEFSTFVVKRILEQNLLPCEPGQLAINEYRVGEGLIPHIDKTLDYGDEVIGVSLGSDIMMDFVGPKDQKIAVFLPRRSLYVMQGEARYKWKHGIPGRRKDKLEDGRILLRSTRVSLTYRLVDKENYKGEKGEEHGVGSEEGNKEDGEVKV